MKVLEYKNPGFIFENPGIGILKKSRDPGISRDPAGACMGIASKIYEEKENGLQGYRNGCVDGCVELNGYKDGCVDGYMVGCGGWLLGWLCGMVVDNLIF